MTTMGANMGFWRKAKPDPPWLTGIPAQPVPWPPVHAGRLQSLSYDPKHDDSLELNVMVAWYRACMDGRVKAESPSARSVVRGAERAPLGETHSAPEQLSDLGTATA
ncbi:MAG: hypothetical protein KGI98_08125 [Euryarchaeota archaeon]|nr:hypothetical protein [Euryarchaeota archaeon]